MSAGQPSGISGTRIIAFFALWLLAVVLLYFGHLPYGMYHGKPGQYHWPCLMFIWPAPGVACFCLVFVQWLWASRVATVRKVCFSILAIAVSVPIVMFLGFIWLLVHMAP